MSTATATQPPALRPSAAQLTANMAEVKKATAALPEAQAKPIVALFHVAKTEGWSNREVGEKVGYEASVIHRVFRGTYEGSVANVVAKIKRFLSLYEERSRMAAPDFVETSLTRRVFQTCDFALVSQTIAMIYGESQIGKTHALLEYRRRNNHGQTAYVRMPSSGGIIVFAQQVAAGLGLSRKGTFAQHRDRILRTVDSRNLLVFDELHILFETYPAKSALRVLGFIREIWDETECGMVLCGTNVWRDELHEGEFKKSLGQLRKRGITPVQLEDRPKPADLAKFWRYYDLKDPAGRAQGIVEDIIHEHGLGKLIKVMRAATRRASKKGKKLSWTDFVFTHDTLAALGRKS